MAARRAAIFVCGVHAAAIAMTGNMPIRALGADDLKAYRRLRLDALRASPEAFSATLAEEMAMEDAQMLPRVSPPAPGLSLGGFAGEELVAMAAYVPNERATMRHKATMVAVYVAPGHRGTGLGRGLVEAVIAHAASQRVILHCTVATENTGAWRLYRSLGFVAYGIEPAAICREGRFFDDALLALDLRGGISPLRPGGQGATLEQ
jgi:ribosomal protein S18 acetylase RimI-like enzyme